MRTRLFTALALAAACLPLLGPPARGQQVADNPFRACERAAAKAEREWFLPSGLLSAIGLVESGRADQNSGHRVAWPWAINAAGSGYYAPSKSAAIATVHALQARGIRMIDVGCFQVDLFYHPWAFATLDEAFDPEANADAAAAILSRNRFTSTGWERAVALYHSADLMRGGIYSQRVLAVWPWARARIGTLPLDGELPVYAVLLSAQARLVKVIMPAEASAASAPAPERTAARRAYGRSRRVAAPEVVYLIRPQNLPRVVSPGDSSGAPVGLRASEPRQLPNSAQPPSVQPSSFSTSPAR
jgi:hypothetical protein